MKKVLIALLCILIALCFVSCGGNEAGGNPAGGGNGGGGSGIPIVEHSDTVFSYSIVEENGEQFHLIIDYSSPDFMLEMMYSNNSLNMDNDYFDSVKLGGGASLSSMMAAGGTVFTGIEYGVSKSDVLSYYFPPTEGNWYLTFSKSGDSSKTKSHKILKTYTDQMYDWVESRH